MNKVIIISICLLFSFSMNAQNIFGKWKTIDDETGEEKSIVEIYRKDNEAYGKIIKIFNPDKQDAICSDCSEDDPRKDKRILGMEIVQGMEYDLDDEEWEDGTILDPNNGKVYDCKMWIGDDGNLKVRGYIAFFFRTQTWKKIN